MMKINITELSKRYLLTWVFKNISYEFKGPGIYALLGANGSGKSTLMRIIAGIQNPSKGTCNFELNGKVIAPEDVYKYIVYCAPAMEIIEEMTLIEFLEFHFSFKKPINGLSIDEMMELMQLKNHRDQLILEFSSGMKQRIKLAQAFFSDCPFVFVDEPCSNLDTNGVNLYQDWLHKFSKDRIIIVGSNDPREYPGALGTIDLMEFKNF